MKITHQAGVGRLRALSMAVASVVVLASVIAPAAATADTGSTNTIKVLNSLTNSATTTINPAATGGSFTVKVVANGAVDVSGAGAGLAFDKAKLQLTAIAKDATEVSNGATFLGFPSSGAIATFIANANTSGQIPNISWSYLDGTSFETANGDHGVYSATFSVIALGDSTLTPDSAPAILDGRAGTYGGSLAVTVVTGSVVNHAATPPSGSITALPAWIAGNTLAVTWGGTAGSNPIASYDVRYRKAAWNGTFGAYATWLSATALTGANLGTAPGYTYCLSERARDTAASVSAWTAETCTAAPLDDRSLTRVGSWALKTGSAFYRGTYVQTTSLGAKLTRTGVRAKRIALVASTCSTCGTVSVYLGTKLLKTISLKSATTANKRLFTVYTFSAVTSGTLTIKVTTSGKKVIIDGVVLSAR